MKRVSLGDLQMAIMRVLWQRDEAAVAEVHGELYAERGLAPTTIATMLVKMEKKGVVTHTQEGRKYLYRPAVTEGDVQRSMVSEMTERLFQGNVAALVSHLLEDGDLEARQVAEIRDLIQRHDKEKDEDGHPVAR